MRNYLRMTEVSSCADISTSLPIILVGAGLSLERERAYLRQAEAHYCIVAVDTALPILRAEKITPDIVIALESQIYNVRDVLAGIDSETILALDITAHPSLLRIIGGRRVALFSSSFAEITLLKLLEACAALPLKIAALGSVGVAALYLALQFTTENVYVIGLDFNYQMGKTHCRGAPFLTSMLNRAHLLDPDPLYAFCIARAPSRVADKYGRPSFTEPTLLNSNSLLRQLAYLAERAQRGGAQGTIQSEGAQRGGAQGTIQSEGAQRGGAQSAIKSARAEERAEKRAERCIYDCAEEGLFFTERRVSIRALAERVAESDAPQRAKVTIQRWNESASLAERMRALVATLQRRIELLLSASEKSYLNMAEAYLRTDTARLRARAGTQEGALARRGGTLPYNGTLPQSGELPLSEAEFASLDFLALGYDGGIPYAQHHRYAALEYYRHLRHYLR